MTQDPSFKLTTIRFSHYNEKARWTLDRLGIAYAERPLMPIVHFFVTPFVAAGAGEADSQSSRFSTPILAAKDGTRIADSSKIMRYLSDRYLEPKQSLFPTAEVSALDEHYNRYLGPHTRRVFYSNVLSDQGLMFELADRNVSPAQARLFKLVFPLARKRIVSGLGVAKERVDRSVGYIYKEFEDAGKRLKDGRPFLFGDRFTAADLSFACLGGVAILPTPSEGYGGYLPPRDGPCEELNRLANDLRTSEVGQWVLDLYHTQRGERRLPAKPLLRIQ